MKMCLSTRLCLVILSLIVSTRVAAQLDEFDGRSFRVKSRVWGSLLEVPNMNPHHGIDVGLSNGNPHLLNRVWRFLRIDDEYYCLVSEASGHALARKSLNDGRDTIFQQIFDPMKESQRWRIEYVEESERPHYYKLVSPDGSQVLGHQVDRDEKGQWVSFLSLLKDVDNGNTQHWWFWDYTNHFIAQTIRNIETGAFLTLGKSSGRKDEYVTISTAMSPLDQTWQLYNDIYISASLSDSWNIKSLYKHGYLKSYQSSSDSYPFIIYREFFPTTLSATGSKWSINRVDGGMQIASFSGLLLTVLDTKPNTRIALLPEDASLAQKWEFSRVDPYSETHGPLRILPQRFPPSASSSLRIEAEDFDKGKGYGDTTLGNTGNSYRNTGVDIRGDSSGSGFIVTDIQDGEWMKYTISETPSPSYDIVLRVASPSDGNQIKLAIQTGYYEALDEVNRGYVWWAHLTPSKKNHIYLMDVPNTGDRDSFVEISIPNALGNIDPPYFHNSVIIQAIGSGLEIDWIEFRLTDHRPTGSTVESDFLSYFPDSVVFGPKSASPNWLGNLRKDLFPWINHEEHGWLYCDGIGKNRIRFWDSHLGWLNTTPNLYPTLTRESDAHTLVYSVGSMLSETVKMRRFWDENDQKWIDVTYSHPPIKLE